MGHGRELGGYIKEVRRSRMNKGLQDGMKKKWHGRCYQTDAEKENIQFI